MENRMIKHKEIILVRVIGPNLEFVINEVNKILVEINTVKSMITVELYRNMSLPTDLSVHIDYYDSKKRNAPCAICHRLAEALKEFGLINHSVWAMES